jgi:hypothetical protein
MYGHLYVQPRLPQIVNQTHVLPSLYRHKRDTQRGAGLFHLSLLLSVYYMRILLPNLLVCVQLEVACYCR